MTVWKKIDSAPPAGTIKMFVVQGFDIDVGIGHPYTTDPWCVWRDEAGAFVRWPHPQPPTHWCELPELHEDHEEAADRIDELEQELALMKDQKRRADDAEAFNRRMMLAKEKIKLRQRGLLARPFTSSR